MHLNQGQLLHVDEGKTWGQTVAYTHDKKIAVGRETEILLLDIHTHCFAQGGQACQSIECFAECRATLRVLLLYTSDICSSHLKI